MDARSHVPVLVVGGGPAGLVCAIALARAGVECSVIERRAPLPAHPRATAVSLRTMELLRAWGLEEAVRAGGPEVDWQMCVSETLASAEDGQVVATGMPSREQSRLVSPTSPACVPQDHLEPVLLDHLRSLQPGSVSHGVELTGLKWRADSYEATVRNRSGQERPVRAEYVVGADGARGATRELLGIDIADTGEVQSAISAVFRAPLWELVGSRRFGIYSTQHPDAPGVFLPAGAHDRWIYGQPMSPGGLDPRREQGPLLRRQIRAGSGVPDLNPRFERIGRFSFAAGLAETFRRDNAFLVGDAAHRVTPRGGTGMNMAIQGAFDLGWKLAWVIRGWAASELLDTYEQDRRCIARHNIERSLDENGSERDASEEMRVDLAGRIAHVWTEAPGGRRSTLDLLSAGLTLFAATGGRWEEAAARLTRTPPLSVHRLGILAARGVGLGVGAALLARPDGVPASMLTAGSDDAGSLRSAIGCSTGCASAGSLRQRAA